MGQTITRSSMHPAILAAWEAIVAEHKLGPSVHFVVVGDVLEARVPGGRAPTTHCFGWIEGAWILR